MVTGFALIWHIWWMVDRRLDRRLRNLRRFRLARSLRVRIAGGEAGADRRRAPAGANRARGGPREAASTPVAYSEAEAHGPRKVGARARARRRLQGPATKRIITGYGFWIFLLSDFILFAGFYAAYAVLSHATAGGPTAVKLFDLQDPGDRNRLSVAVELRLRHGEHREQCPQHAVDADRLCSSPELLGVGFLGLEVSEFAKMLAMGAGPDRSAFLSAFFALVGLHGVHVTIGLLWLGTMMAQFWAKGFRADIMRRGLCFALFWHALDIIWVGIFTNVYLLGTSP